MNAYIQNHFEFLTKHLPHLIKKHRRLLQVTEKQLHSLDGDELSQWTSIMILKCNSLLQQQSTANDPDLTASLVELIVLSHKFKCVYERKPIEIALKEVYLKEYGEKVTNAEMIKVFKNFNFEIGDYQVLTYEDPWYVKAYRFFTD